MDLTLQTKPRSLGYVQTRNPLPPPLDMSRVVHYEAETIGKQAVGIRLKCLVVLNVQYLMFLSGVIHTERLQKRLPLTSLVSWCGFHLRNIPNKSVGHIAIAFATSEAVTLVESERENDRTCT